MDFAKSAIYKSYLMIKILICSLLLSAVISQVTPPTWPNRFHQSFVETYNTTHIHISGKYYYDSDRGYTRVDRIDGRFDAVCGSITPNITTPCTQLIRDQKRWIVFPERRTCCMCCDAAHGCGILSPGWLKEAKYEGQETLSGESFNKWSIPDGPVMDYYYARKDAKSTPRRIDAGHARIEDFIMSSYSEEQVPESVFALPSYCNSTCSPATKCGMFQGKNLSSQ